MKKLIALSFALALTFSTTVCAAEPNLDRIDTLAADAEKSLPEYVANAVSEMEGIENVSTVASASNLVTEGKTTKATCVVNKVDTGAIAYAQKQAAAVGGSVLAVTELSAPGVNLVDAQVTLAVVGVKAGDAVSVYKSVKGEWTAVDVVAVADDAVTIKFDSKGIYTLIK